MNPEHVAELVKCRMEQARCALEDARYLFEGNRSTQAIVNRLYYAMFYSTLAVLQTVGKITSKHTGVMSLFDREFIAKGAFPKAMSKDLHDAFDLRQTSDYQPIKPVSPETAHQLMRKADVFVQMVESYLKTREYL